MTDQDLTNRVAELCGWKDIENRKGQGRWFGRMPPEYNGWSLLPDYANDLNAMHGAEMLLSKAILTGTYATRLMFETSACKEGTLFFCATARQRAAAFVKVMEEK
jgi:hypothetical protein